MSIFFIFVMGFSQGYYVLFQVVSSIKKGDVYLSLQSYDEDAEDAEDHPMPNPVESILGIFLMSLGATHNQAHNFLSIPTF